ncbi:MAG: OmpH family outer membrane protein [Muribaculaceae bacterium]|nr:OmpH family outer membrane protein [Muribaculaceae bacterium]MDE6645121.1 OmpH family outer membrane protein [Muribaculaceae bacterium]
MKKTALGAAGLLMLCAVASCSDNAKTTTTPEAPAATTATAGESFASSTNIRYIDLDTIMEYYHLAKDVQEFTIRTYSDLEQAQRTEANKIQKFGQSIEDKARSNGYLTEASYNADVQKLNKMQADAQNALAAMERKAQQDLGTQNQTLNDSIQSFINDYNKGKHYDAILFRAAGVYFNPALDITKEVIEGLNSRYNIVK